MTYVGLGVNGVLEKFCRIQEPLFNLTKWNENTITLGSYVVM